MPYNNKGNTCIVQFVKLKKIDLLRNLMSIIKDRLPHSKQVRDGLSSIRYEITDHILLPGGMGGGAISREILKSFGEVKTDAS